MLCFLVDQQLPQALARSLSGQGHDARHIKEYPGGTTLDDDDIARIADSEDRIMVTKDDDFRISHLLRNRPVRLLHITCGNISTRELLALVDRYHRDLISAVASYRYVELDRGGVAVHDPS